MSKYYYDYATLKLEKEYKKIHLHLLLFLNQAPDDKKAEEEKD